MSALPAWGQAHTYSADDEPFTFCLWHAVGQLTDRGVRYTFDVTASAFCLLNDGDLNSMRAFATALGANGGNVESWRIRRYCTPYYSDYPTHTDWRDRLQRTWRVEVDMSGGSLPAGYLGIGPVRADAWDPTFDDQESSWERGPERCIVIVDSDGEPDVDFLTTMPGVVGVETSCHRYRRVPVTVARVDLGTLEFPAALTRVDAVLNACADRGLRTQVREAQYRFV